MKEFDTVILAGGLGERMGELCQKVQKCMLPYKGKPILEHILDNINDSFGKSDILINLGNEGEQVKRYFGKSYKNLNIRYVEDKRHLETKNRLLLAKDNISRPFLFIAGDIIAPGIQMQKVFERFQAEPSLVGVFSGASDHKPAIYHPLIVLFERYIQEIHFPSPAEWRVEDKRDMQVSFFNPEFLDFALKSKNLFISQVVSEIINENENKKCFGCEVYDGEWKHFSVPDDLSK
ncbi:MAG: NTP transferase domain-containing protein [Patescibacteria group bacterium]